MGALRTALTRACADVVVRAKARVQAANVAVSFMSKLLLRDISVAATSLRGGAHRRRNSGENLEFAADLSQAFHTPSRLQSSRQTASRSATPSRLRELSPWMICATNTLI